MFTALCSSAGLGVGDDPSGFDVGEDNWSWRPPTPPKPERNGAQDGRKERRSGGGGGEGNRDPRDGDSSATTASAGDSFAARSLTWLRLARAEPREDGGRPAGATLRLRSALSRSFSFGGTVRSGFAVTGDLGVEGDHALSEAVLEALADVLEPRVQRFRFVPSDGRGAHGGVGVGLSGGTGSRNGCAFPIAPPAGAVSLDLSTAETLQQALRSRGGCGRSSEEDGGGYYRGAMAEPRREEPRRKILPALGAIFSLGAGGGEGGQAGDSRRPTRSPSMSGDGRGQHRAALVGRLRRLAREITALRLRRGPGLLVSASASPLSVPQPSIDLQTFPALQELWLEEIPLECVEGLFTLRLQLKSLSFGNALLENLTALLAPHATPEHEWRGGSRGTVGRGVGGTGRSDVSGGSVDDGEHWRVDRSADTHPDGDDLAGLRLRLGTGTPKLRWALLEVLSVRWCGLRELDPSLRLLPRVRRLSLAYNRIHSMDFFQDCAALEELDLSFNRIKSVENAHWVLGNIRTLSLRGNRITRTLGLELMYSLEDLDLSCNDIGGLEEVSRLSTLPLLRRVAFAGNTLEAEERKHYRVTVLSLLYQGKGGELERELGLSIARSGFGLSSSLAGVRSGVPTTYTLGGAGGIALDGQLSSRKELSELVRLRFTHAVRVRAPPSQYLERQRVGDGRGQKQKREEDWQHSIPAPIPPLPRQRSGSVPTHEGDEGSNDNHGVGGGGNLDRQPPPRQGGSPVNSFNGSMAKAASLGRRRVRGGARRRGTRAAAIDGPLSNAGKAEEAEAGGGGGGDPRHPFSFCTVPLPAEGVVDAEEDVESRRAADVRHDLEGDPRSPEVVPEAAEQSNAGGGNGEPAGKLRQSAARPSRSWSDASAFGEGDEENPIPEASSPEKHLERRRRWSARGQIEGQGGYWKDARGVGPSSVLPLGEPSTGDAGGDGDEDPPLVRSHRPPLQLGRSSGDSDETRRPTVAAAAVSILAGARNYPTLGAFGDESPLPPLPPLPQLPPPVLTGEGGLEGEREKENRADELASRLRATTSVPVRGGLSVEGDAGSSSPLAPPPPSEPQEAGSSSPPAPPPPSEPQEAGSSSPPVPPPPSEPQEAGSSSLEDPRGIPRADSALALAEFFTPPCSPQSAASRSGLGEEGGGDGENVEAFSRGAASLPDESAEIGEGSLRGSTVSARTRDGLDNKGAVVGDDVEGKAADGIEGVGIGIGAGDGLADGGDGYRGDAAYASLLIAEHLELYLRQQVFGGDVSYVSYSGARLQSPVMHAHREQSKTSGGNRVVAVFRETVLPCLPEGVTSSAPGGGVAGSPAELDFAWERRSAEDLVVAGVARVVRLRGLAGEARGSTMGEVACVVVATERLLFVMDGAFAKKDALFSEAPRPRVLLVLPLGCLEKTTIGFRLQKLEVHFNASCMVKSRGGGSTGRRMTSQGSMAAAARAATTGGASFWGGISSPSQASSLDCGGLLDDGGEPEERVSIALLTRDRSRTVNLIQTLEPLATKARRLLGLPPTMVNNRDDDTLEAIAKALPRSFTNRAIPRPSAAVSAPTSPIGPAKTAGLIARLGMAGGGDDRDSKPMEGARPRATSVALDVAAVDDGHDNVGPGGGGDRTQGGRSVDVASRAAQLSLDSGGGETSAAASLDRKPPPSIETGDLPPPSPAVAAPAVATADSRSSSVSGSEDVPASLGEGSDTGGGCGDGAAVVVFQLLMQRWELRPWVVAPRTLVASKEQLALMDEDHSRMQALLPSSQQQQQQLQPPSPATSTRPSPSVSRASSPPATPSHSTPRFSSGGRPRRTGRPPAATASGYPAARRRPFVRDGSVPEPSTVSGSGDPAIDWGSAGAPEMVCLEAVDLADVLGVHQESSAPEQVMIELRGERAFDPRRQWRLHCRTRGSAEMIASTLLRLSRDRVRHRRQTSWWKR